MKKWHAGIVVIVLTLILDFVSSSQFAQNIGLLIAGYLFGNSAGNGTS